MQVVLVEPQIPPNTGNIARLCAATRTSLYLVGRLGFELSDRYLRRAGLDYWEWVDLHVDSSAERFFAGLPEEDLFFFSTRARVPYWTAGYTSRSWLVFGSETAGLPPWIFERYPHRFWNIPMLEPGVRSLNLSSAVAIVLYEAIRQKMQKA